MVQNEESLHSWEIANVKSNEITIQNAKHDSYLTLNKVVLDVHAFTFAKI